ncbi:MAG: Mut7-C RNAse domain-containing protein [Desulfurococcales archaeon]|nr:Mut7-C RNAse domain-containing protein [Desulfurococcales archaeon]
MASPKCKRDVRFIVDKMHGDLVRWLRILGYNTLYMSNAGDKEIAEKAASSHRILVSRDKGLVHRARKLGVRAYLITGVEPEDKLAELALYTGICLDYDEERTRCPECNTPLRVVDKGEVKGRVPPRVYEEYDRFLVCPNCGKVYWYGSHWIDIRRRLESARQQLRKMKRWRP